MSNIPKDKFLTEFEQRQKENGMWGGKRYATADAKKWKAKQPLSEDQVAALERRDKKGFVVLIVGVAILLIGAVIVCMMQV